MSIIRICLIILLFTLNSLQAAIIIVDRADDLITGGDGGCDLRDAINSANINFGLEDCVAGDNNAVDAVLINVAGPIQLSAPLGILGSIFIGTSGPVGATDPV